MFSQALHQSSTTGVRLEAVANIGLAYCQLSIVYFLKVKTGTLSLYLSLRSRIVHALILGGVDFRRSHMDLVSVLQQTVLYMMHSHLVSIVTIERYKSGSHMSI